MNKKQRSLLLRIIIAAVFFIPLYLLSEGIIKNNVPQWAVFVLFLIPYLVVGYDILRKAFKGIRNRQVFDENFLMAIATIGAIVVGEYGEGVAVMLLYQVGELFQSIAVGKSRQNISALMDIRPDYANIEDEQGSLTKVDPYELSVGDIFVVRPGEKVPLDGVVEEGNGSMDTAALTGESRPVSVKEGDTVLSGSINMTGVLKLRATAEFDESTASRILDLVENAAARKSRSENFISKFARYYTPVVCAGALALALLPPLFCMVTGTGMAGYGSLRSLWGDWILRACTFLVISCPCAVVISVPLSFFAGIGGAGSQGILVKGSNYLETLSQVRTVAFDKTGTMTRGNFAVTGVHHSPVEKERLLEYAAHAECHSSHPISLSLLEAYRQATGRRPDPQRVSDVEEISGQGVTAAIICAINDGSNDAEGARDKDAVKHRVAVGNEKLMAREGLQVDPCHDTGTIIHVAVDGIYHGHIVISDELKPGAKRAVAELKKAGVSRIVMLTGDAEPVAAAVAEKTGIEEYHAQLLPQDKVSIVEKLLSESGKGKKTAFVGDGINDAPVLSRADIGIAMGALGSDAAIEAADVVLMDDDPLKIARAVRISRRCLRIVKENIVFALTVKVVCLILAALGIANMWVAIGADVGVMILAVLNAIRCLFVKKEEVVPDEL